MNGSETEALFVILDSAQKSPVLLIAAGWRLHLTIETSNPFQVKDRRIHRMTKRFKVGDHISWNSEAVRVAGTIIAVHTEDFTYKGYVHHASKDDPQYEIRSDKTDHVAAHREGRCP